MRTDERPWPWRKSLLAIIPGLFAAAGLVRTDFSVAMLIGVIALAALLVMAYWRNDRQLPAWSLMAAGMFASIGLSVAAGVIGGLASMLLGDSARELVLLLFCLALIVLWLMSARSQRVDRSIWGLLIAIVVCQLIVRVKYFVLFGVSWPVAGQWLRISLYAAISVLLLPIAIGWRVAPRYGAVTLLLVIGLIYPGFQPLIDVNRAVSSQLGDSLGFIIYQAIIPLLFTVCAPLWWLRARSARSRAVGGLVLIGLAVLLDLVIVGWAYGDLPVIIWLSFIPYTLSVLLTLVVADRLYR